MNLATLFVLALVLVLAVLAVRFIRKHKLISSCGGNCTGCSAGCKYRKS